MRATFHTARHFPHPVTILITIVLLLHPYFLSAQQNKPARVGILTDCQYCDCEPDEKRIYRYSLQKLEYASGVLNSESLDAIFHLGDMIDRNYASYDSVMPRFANFRPPVHLVLGNHDYMIQKKYRPLVMERVGLKEGYYTVDLQGWRFIVLNGNDLSFYAPQDKERKKERNVIVSDLYAQMRISGLPWNGGIGITQMRWLKERLKESDSAGLNVIVACHFPLFTRGNHNLFNNETLFALISGYSCVKAYFCGHYHPGSYMEKEGIHLVNFKGMVDTQQNAFAVVTLTNDSILVKGYGREPDRRLKVR